MSFEEINEWGFPLLWLYTVNIIYYKYMLIIYIVVYIVFFCPKHNDFTLQQKRFNSWTFQLKKTKKEHQPSCALLGLSFKTLEHSWLVVNLITSLEPSSSTWKWNMTLNNKTKNAEPDWCRCELQTMNPSQKATFKSVQLNKSLLKGVPKPYSH